MNKKKILNQIKLRRKKRTRAKIHGTAERPRFSIFRSNRYIYAQLINDEIKKTLVGASTKEIDKLGADKKHFATKNKVILSGQLGELIAKKAIEKGIKKAVFDRGNYKYHGRVKAVAEAAKKGGLQL